MSNPREQTYRRNGSAQCATPGCLGDPGLMPHCPACQWHGLVGVLEAEERQRAAVFQVDYIHRATAQKLRAARKRRAVYGLIYVAALLGFMAMCWESWPR